MSKRSWNLQAILCGVGMVFGLMCGAARADTTYTWSVDKSTGARPHQGSGDLTVTDGLVTAISGEFDGIAITGLIPIGSVDYLASLSYQPGEPDNAFPLDTSGVGFSLASNDLPFTQQDIAIFHISGSSYGISEFDPEGWFIQRNATFTYAIAPASTSAVPEPAGAGLLGMAITGVIAASKRRRAATDAPVA